MKTPELSIVAIVINNFEVTERFVSSIRQYTKGNYELILIDNASDEKKSIDFIRKAADKSFRFDKRVSVAEAWNKGIEISRGNFVAIANNDVVYCIRCLSTTDNDHLLLRGIGTDHTIVIQLFPKTLNRPLSLDKIT